MGPAWPKCDESVSLYSRDDGFSGVQPVQAPAIVQDDLARSGKLDHTLTEELRQRSRNGFEVQTQIIADIPTAHRERQHACYGEATIHFQQKISYAFHRTHGEARRRSRPKDCGQH